MDFLELLKTDFSIKTDSRDVGSGDIFLALKGTRADDEEMNSHSFVKQAISNGASYAIVSEDLPWISEEKLIKVANTFEAYAKIGNHFRKKFKGKVIGITGSSGKTSTKEALKQMLSHFGKVYATPKNLNSQLGVPQVLCDINMTADFAIIEMGMSHVGEIQKLTKMVEPDIAIVTNVYPMHLDYFNSVEQIAFEKSQIFNGLSENGVAIYNADSLQVDVLRNNSADYKTITFGEKSRDICLKKVENTISHISINKEIIQFALPEDNIDFRYNSLAVIAVAMALNLDLKKLFPLIKEIKPADGRGAIIPIKYDGKRITLIDDAYAGGHAVAMEIGLQRLMKAKGKRKIAVIGNMAELGNQMKKQHKRVGRILNSLKIDKIFLVGEPTKWIADEISNHKNFVRVEKLEELGTQVEDMLKYGDVLFIKGARYSSQVYKLADKLKIKK